MIISINGWALHDWRNAFVDDCHLVFWFTLTIIAEKHCNLSFPKNKMCFLLSSVSRVARYYAKNAAARPECSARKVQENEAKKQLVIDHVETFTCRASRYGRRGAPGQKYLRSDLSVKKMHDLFKQQDHEGVRYSLYDSVFRHRFNLGFGHPATDACATCAKFCLKVRDPSLTEEEKRFESACFIYHRRRACVFYDLLGKVDNEAVAVCFDMMQNLVLPKTPIGQAYYSQQQTCMSSVSLSIMGWTVSKPRMTSIFIHGWNMTVLDHCFRWQWNGSIRHAQRLWLFRDSCFGQNKNMNVLSMLVTLRIHFRISVLNTHFQSGATVFFRRIVYSVG